MTPTLETDRLRLRPLRIDDAERVQVIFNNIEITRYLAAAIPWPYPPGAALEFITAMVAEMEARKRFVWAITERDGSDDVIGLIELTPAGPFHRGFWLVPEHWAKGYMSEAVAAVNDFAFDVVGLKVMRLGNALPNVGSHRLKAKSGAIKVGIDKDVPFVGGVFDEEIWELTVDAWRAHRESFLAR